VSDLQKRLDALVQEAVDDLIFGSILDFNEIMFGTAYGPWRQFVLMSPTDIQAKYEVEVDRGNDP